MVCPSLGEGDGKQAEKVVVCSLHCNIGFNQGLPFSNEGTELVGGKIEAVKVSETVLSLDFIDSQLHFAESMVFVGLEVGQGDFEDPALQGVVGILETRCTID